MAKIVFEHTLSSTYASQGGTPSGKEGYNVWLKNDQEYIFLGWFLPEELEYWTYFYQQEGDECYLKA